MIVRGSGAYVFDQHGRRYLDGLSGLFVSQVGHGRQEIAEAGARQAAELAYFPLWSYAHPKAIELAAAAGRAGPGRPEPGVLHHQRLGGRRVGLEAGQAVLQADRPARTVQGDQPRHRLPRDIHGRARDHRPGRHQVPVRAADARAASGCRTPTSTGRPRSCATTWRRSAMWAADEIERAILREGPKSVAAVFLEPVQNSGGCFPPPPGYFQRVREICDRYGVLLVSDEVICAFGRLGYYFGAERYGYQPDIITFAKGVTSGYAPLGGMLVSDALMEPFSSGTATFLHGITFAGHPVSAAVALANLDIFEKERPAGERPGERGRVPRHPGEALRPADRRGGPGGRLLLRHRAGQGQGHPGDVRRRRVRAAAARVPVQRAVRRRACRAGATTAATRSSSWPRRSSAARSTSTRWSTSSAPSSPRPGRASRARAQQFIGT